MVKIARLAQKTLALKQYFIFVCSCPLLLRVIPFKTYCTSISWSRSMRKYGFLAYAKSKEPGQPEKRQNLLRAFTKHFYFNMSNVNGQLSLWDVGTAKIQNNLRICAGCSGPLLSVYARRHIFHIAGPNLFYCRDSSYQWPSDTTGLHKIRHFFKHLLCKCKLWDDK